MRTATASKPLTMPDRFLNLCKEPVELITAVCAIGAALITGGTLREVLSYAIPTSPLGAVISAVAAVLAVFVVYYFRFKIQDRRARSDDHKTDTAAQTVTIATLNKSIEQLQRKEFSLQRWYEEQIHNERRIKHDIDQILTVALVSAVLVKERVECVIDLTEILLADESLPASTRAHLQAIVKRASGIYTGKAIQPEHLETRIVEVSRVPEVPPFNPLKSLDGGARPE